MTASLLRHETVLALLVCLALASLAFLSDRFFTPENLLNQGRLMSEVGLVALAMTFVIVTGGIDLSVGSLLALVSVVCAQQMNAFGLAAGIIAGIAAGALAGLLNGVIVAKARVPAFIRTLPSPSSTSTRRSGCASATPSPIDPARPIEPIM